MTRSPLDGNAEHLLRDLAPQVLGAAIRRFRDFAACEDAVQEALMAAAAQWPREGIPDNPRGWLIHVAFRRVTDQMRAEAARRRREAIVVSLVPPEDQLALAADSDDRPPHDDSVDLLFMCCHPTLSAASAIALTLRAVGGLTTAEIASAFMVPEATMAQRISRAKQNIKDAGLPREVPDAAGRRERVGPVLHVLYLMFNEGYATSSGVHLQLSDLCNEAIRLTRTLFSQLPDVTEVAGLLALMLLTDARRAARAGAHGELIPIDEQERSLWDRGMIDEGVALICRGLTLGPIGD